MHLADDFRDSLAKSPGFSRHRGARASACQCFTAVYFALADYDKALDWHGEFLRESENTLPSDSMLNGHVLHIMIHFELGNETLVNSLVRAFRRALNANDSPCALERTFCKYIVKSPAPLEEEKHWKKFKDAIVAFQNTPEEAEKLRHIDLLPWLESKIQKRTLKEIFKVQ